MKCICTECQNLPSGAADTCLKDFWLFNGFTEGQFAELKKIGIRKIIQPGQTLFTQGAPVTGMFLIKAGRIRLGKVHPAGHETTLDYRKGGDIIGENIFSGETHYPMSAWALEETVTCGFDLQAFHQMILGHPEIGLTVIQSMGGRLASMTDRIDTMSENSLTDRLRKTIEHIAKEHGRAVDDGVELDIPLTHEDLAFMVGAHRVSVTKAMKILTHAGTIKKSGKKIILM